MLDKEQAIRDIVYDDDKIVEAIEKAPQSYNSILQHMKDNGTMHVVLRRRIKRLLKEQKIWKLRVPGTRFGLVLFCTPEHDYKILVVHGLIKVRIFYMFDFEETDKHIILKDYWELVNPNWSKWKYSDEVLELPRYTSRDGLYILWD